MNYRLNIYTPLNENSQRLRCSVWSFIFFNFIHKNFPCRLFVCFSPYIDLDKLYFSHYLCAAMWNIMHWAKHDYSAWDQIRVTHDTGNNRWTRMQCRYKLCSCELMFAWNSVMQPSSPLCPILDVCVTCISSLHHHCGWAARYIRLLTIFIKSL